MSKYGDPTQFFHHDNLFSRAAYSSIKDDKARLRRLVVNYIRQQGIKGATCDEVENALELSHQTASARITEAKIKELVYWNGKKRKTRSGRNAAVLVTPENFILGEAHVS